LPKARVFIIDDSVVARRMLAEVIGKDPGLEVAGTAANGRIALEKLPQVLPDLVTLDVSMPELGGLETLKELRRLYPDLPVLMVSAQTERGAETTIDALFLGAADYVTKPSAAKGVAASVARFNETLTDKARDLCAKRLEAPPSPPASNPRVIPPAPSTPVRGLSRKQRVEVVVLGASTGGPLVLAEVLSALPGDFPVPVVVVQHMLPLFTARLCERLAARCALSVREAVNGERLVAGGARLAPGDYHVAFERMKAEKRQGETTLRVHQGLPVNFCRPSVDVLFESAAERFAGGTLAVVLTGMGQDGKRGCEAVRAAGGQVLVQDAETSTVWGMPGAVARAGLADATLPRGEIAREIVRRTLVDRARAPAVKEWI